MAASNASERDRLCRLILQRCDQEQLRAICRYANAVGAITTTERGAIPALPTHNQVEQFLISHPVDGE